MIVLQPMTLSYVRWDLGVLIGPGMYLAGVAVSAALSALVCYYGAAWLDAEVCDDVVFAIAFGVLALLGCLPHGGRRRAVLVAHEPHLVTVAMGPRAELIQEGMGIQVVSGMASSRWSASCT